MVISTFLLAVKSFGAVPNLGIVIDGDMADWASVTASVTDASDDISQPGTNILEFKVAHNETHLFVYSRHAGPIVSEDAGAGGQGRIYYLVFIDLDNNRTTGWIPHFTDFDCYSPSMVGTDFELIFEQDWNDMMGGYELQYFYGNGGISPEENAQTDIQNGIMRIARGNYSRKVAYKTLGPSIPGDIVLTDDLSKSGFTPGDDIYMDHAFSSDLMELEVSVDFRAALRNQNGTPNLRTGQIISLGAAVESSPWDPCGDGTADIENYALLGIGDPTFTPSPTITNTPTVTPTPINCVQAATLTLDCTGGLGLLGPVNDMRLRFHSGVSQATTCGLSSCPLDSTLVNCVINCRDWVGSTDCVAITNSILSDIGTCIDNQSGGAMSWSIVTGPGRTPSMYIQSETLFHCCLCGSEVNAPCMEGLGYPLGFCSVYNICDGTVGNETDDPAGFVGGLGFGCEEALCPGASPPTATPTNTIPAPTLTPTPTPTETDTPGPTETPTETPFVCDSGYYVLDSLGGRHRVGNPIEIVGPVYFGMNLARDLERAVCDIAGSTNEDLVVLDAFGIAHFVQNPGCNIVQDFTLGDMSTLATFPEGRAVDIQITADSAGFWILTDYGEVYRAGSALGGASTSELGVGQMGVLGFDVPTMRDSGTMNLPTDGASLRAVSFVALDEDGNSQADGYILLDSMGGRFHYRPDGSEVQAGTSAGLTGNEPLRLLDPTGYVWPFFPGLDIARDLEPHPSQGGVIILDGWDGIHPVPVNDPSNPVWFARNEDPVGGGPAQAVGMPYIVMGWDDPATAAPESTLDAHSIFTDLEFSAGCPDGGLYTLDKFGGVFALGDVRSDENDPSPGYGGSPYFFPFLYAEDMEVFAGDET